MTNYCRIFLLSLLIAFSSCRLTREDVIGKWSMDQNDTLIINKDNSFLIKKNISEIDTKQNTKKDSLKSSFDGKWILYKRAIHFDFIDTTQNFGGGCTTFHYWWTRGSKKNLIRPMTCESPTHEFRGISKIIK